MKYVIKNLHHFYKTEKSIFLLTLCCSLLSVIMFFFSYGLFRVYHEKKLSDITELCGLQIEIINDNASDSLSKSDLERCLIQFSPELSHAIDMILVGARISEATTLDCRFTWENGHYSICKAYADNSIKNNFSNTYFTPEQEQQGSLVALIPGQSEQKEIIIQGKQYTVIGRLNTDEEPIIPYSSLNSYTQLSPKQGISFGFSKAISKQQYNELCDILTSQLADKIMIPPLPQLDAQNASFYNTMILIAVLIVFIAASNFAIQFHYVLTRRKKMLNIYRLCGLDRRSCIRLFMAEALGIILPVCLAGIFLFHVCLLPIFIKLSADWAGLYNLKIYLSMFCVYVGVTGIVLSFMIRKVMAGQI